jgi:hypothetical protein
MLVATLAPLIREFLAAAAGKSAAQPAAKVA